MKIPFYSALRRKDTTNFRFAEEKGLFAEFNWHRIIVKLLLHQEK